MKNKGYLFICEGIDNVGKTTIVDALYESLLSRKIACSKYSFPGKTPNTLGSFVYNLHHGKTDIVKDPINSISLQLLHVASHIDIITRKIIPDLNAGKVVLLDRFWWSTLAYGIANRIERVILKGIVSLENKVLEKTLPTTIYFIEREFDYSGYNLIYRNKVCNEYTKIIKTESLKYRVKVVTNINLESTIKTIENDIIQQIEVVSADHHKQGAENKINPLDKISSPQSYFSFVVPSKVMPSIIYDTYWKFAVERQRVFFNRLSGLEKPWTEDKIMQTYKFTNTYRASDRVSQYLIKNVIYNKAHSLEDTIFRILVFKIFNKIDTWELLESKIGLIDYKSFDYNKYDLILSSALEAKQPIYSAAYIMASGKTSFGYNRKHQNHLALIEYMMRDKFAYKVSKARNLENLYELLIQYPTIGRFLAFQYAIDINYSEACNFSEMDFVVPGPGASVGIGKCFSSLGSYSEADLIRYVTERQNEEFDRLELNFKSLWGRPLQLIDCQNIFCEVDKYSRVAHPEITGSTGRTRIKQRFVPSGQKIDYFFPPEWGINDLIKEGF